MLGRKGVAPGNGPDLIRSTIAKCFKSQTEYYLRGT